MRFFLTFFLLFVSGAVCAQAVPPILLNFLGEKTIATNAADDCDGVLLDEGEVELIFRERVGELLTDGYLVKNINAILIRANNDPDRYYGPSLLAAYDKYGIPLDREPTSYCPRMEQEIDKNTPIGRMLVRG